MAHSYSQCIRYVIRFRNDLKTQEHFDHLLYLLLLRLTVPHDSLLDLHWRILCNRQTLLCGSEYHDSSSLTDRHRCCNVPIKKKFLERYCVRFVFINQLHHTFIYVKQPFLFRCMSFRLNTSILYGYHLTADFIHKTKTNNRNPRVNSQKTQNHLSLTKANICIVHFIITKDRPCGRKNFV
ncbi:hypothetical protein D3C74_391960 [compost metagenome]